MSKESTASTQRDPARSAGVTYVGNRSRGKIKWLWPSIAGLLGLLFFLYVAFMVLRVSGEIEGEEFSPDTFDRRSFNYNKMPLFGWVLRKREVIASSDPVSQHLIAGGYITPVQNDPQTWVLVWDSKTGSNSVDFDARFLVKILDMRDTNNDLVWLNWTMDHDKCAKILWPQVAKLARDGEYWAIPDLMDLAFEAEETKSGDFQATVNQYISDLYFDEAQALFDNDEFDSALDYLDHSIETQPTNKAYELRAKVHRELGNDEKAKEDQAKVGD